MFDTERSTYAFQISMNNVAVMHILQAIRNINQLNSESAGVLLGVKRSTYKHSTVYMWVILNEFIDVSILHPLGNHCKPIFTHCHPEQR